MPKHWCCGFVGAAILRNDTGTLSGGALDLLFKVVCMMEVPGNEGDQWIIGTLVHTGSPDDKWSILASRVIMQVSNFRTRLARVGDTMFMDATTSAAAHPADSMMVMMINMHTGTSSLVAAPPVSPVLPRSCTYVEHNGGGGDEKLWFVCIHDLLVLRLYSHPKPPQEEISTTRLANNETWTLEREVLLRERIVDLADTDGELRPRNVQSRNGYVFFTTDEYGYFMVHLRSMSVQRLSSVERGYGGRLYPFLHRHIWSNFLALFWTVIRHD